MPCSSNLLRYEVNRVVLDLDLDFSIFEEDNGQMSHQDERLSSRLSRLLVVRDMNHVCMGTFLAGHDDTFETDL